MLVAWSPSSGIDVEYVMTSVDVICAFLFLKRARIKTGQAKSQNSHDDCATRRWLVVLSDW